MDLSFMDDYQDRYMQTVKGKGAFLAGVALGELARKQAERIDESPLFKQIHFGKMALRDIKRHLSRVPELTRAYHLSNARTIEKIMVEAGTHLMQSPGEEFGVEGNFAFTIGFMNSWEVIRKIFQNYGTNGTADEAAIENEEPIISTEKEES